MKVAINSLQLFDDRVIIKQDPEEEKTDSGLLYLPPSLDKDVDSKPRTGVIVNMGSMANDGRNRDEQLRIGDSVIFGKYAGIDLKELGDDHLIVRSPDIIGRFDREAIVAMKEENLTESQRLMRELHG